MALSLSKGIPDGDWTFEVGGSHAISMRYALLMGCGRHPEEQISDSSAVRDSSSNGSKGVLRENGLWNCGG